MAKKKDRKSPFATESHEIFSDLDGKPIVCRTKQSGDVYQLRMWIPKEKRYYRVSLKTRDLETAKKRGQKEVVAVLGKLESGKQIFGATLGEAVEQYLEWRKEDVKNGRITKERLITIKSQIKHLVEYKGASTRLNELDRDSCYDYSQWRQSTANAALQTTVRNEQSTINHMMSFAQRKGYTDIDRFDFRQMPRKSELARRDTFTVKEFDTLREFLKVYKKSENSQSEEDHLERLLINDCIIIAAHSLLRVGELWQLKWRDISKDKKEYKDKSEQVKGGARIEVRAEISKTRKPRRVISRGYENFERLRKRSQFRGPDDYVFSSINAPRMFPKRKYYQHWAQLMEGCGFDDHKQRQLSWYSLRHFGITLRLMYEEPIANVAHIAGTSVAQIEKHYGHFNDDMMRKGLMRGFEPEYLKQLLEED